MLWSELKFMIGLSDVRPFHNGEHSCCLWSHFVIVGEQNGSPQLKIVSTQKLY